MSYKIHDNIPQSYPLERYIEKLRIIEAIREFLKDKGFTEVYTPIITTGKDPSPNIESFETTCGFFLITSPEYDMKKLLSQGLEKIFQITHFFRKNEFYELHNPEFLGVEWYEVGKTYRDTMGLSESLIQYISTKVFGKKLSEFERKSVEELFYEAGIPKENLLSMDGLKKSAKALDISISEKDREEDLFNKLFIKLFHGKLGVEKPLILFDYPEYIPSLAKPKGDGFVERFEIFINGIEIGNAYTELLGQKQNISAVIKANKERIKNGSTGGVDEEFLSSTEFLPPSTGIAIGIERLQMALGGYPSFNDILLPLERKKFEDYNLKRILCSRLCYYYKPFSREEGCGSFLFFSKRKDLFPFILKFGHGKLEEIDPAIDKKVFEIICKTCPYLKGYCDFRDNISTIPCGGYKIVYRIIKYEPDTIREIR